MQSTCLFRSDRFIFMRLIVMRVVIFREKHDHWYEMSNFNEGPSINISVRRTHLYEDAFDKLSPDNGKPNHTVLANLCIST